MPSRRTVISARDPDNNIVQILEIVELIKTDPRQTTYMHGETSYLRVDHQRKIECIKANGKRVFFDPVRAYELTEI